MSTRPSPKQWYWENLSATHTGGMVNLRPCLILTEAQSLPSRAQFQEPQGHMLGPFQGREKAGLGSGFTAIVWEISLSLCYSDGN